MMARRTDGRTEGSLASSPAMGSSCSGRRGRRTRLPAPLPAAGPAVRPSVRPWVRPSTGGACGLLAFWQQDGLRGEAAAGRPSSGRPRSAADSEVCEALRAVLVRKQSVRTEYGQRSTEVALRTRFTRRLLLKVMDSDTAISLLLAVYKAASPGFSGRAGHLLPPVTARHNTCGYVHWVYLPRERCGTTGTPACGPPCRRWARCCRTSPPSRRSQISGPAPWRRGT